MTSNTSLLLVLSAVLCACGGSATSNTSSSSSGGTTQTPTPADPVRLPNGDVVTNVSCGDESSVSASGTWDVAVGDSHGTDGNATITIDSGSFVFKTGDQILSFTTSGNAMTLTWKDGAKDLVPIGVTRAASAVDTGIMPLALGGQWTFASNTSGGEQCTASYTGNGFNASCAKVSMPGGGSINGSVVGIRQQEKASVFGALGGVWHLTGEGSEAIDVTVSGNVFTAVSSRASSTRSDWVTVKMCNGVAAGRTSDGSEIAATRH